MRQQLFLCRFDKMSGMKLQGCCNRTFFTIFLCASYSILASITNSLGSSIAGYCLDTECLKNFYEIASDFSLSLNICLLELKATQTATIHKNTSRLVAAKLYLTPRQCTMHLGQMRQNKDSSTCTKLTSSR